MFIFFFGLKGLRKVVNVGKLMFVIHENSIFFFIEKAHFLGNP
jgi:hypothetical protein